MNEQIQEYIPSEDDFRFAVREDVQTDSVFAGESYWKTAVKTFLSKKINIIAVVILMLLVIMSIIGPYLTGNPYDEQNVSMADLAPRISGIADGTETVYLTNGEYVNNRYENLGITDTYYIFGTDNLGRDLFSRCWEGLRVSLLVALAATVINLVIGINYGMISGYFGGKTDMIMQRIVEIAGSIPSLVVVTLLMLVLKPGVGTIILALMITGWMEMSIIARTHTLRIKDQEYILAARTQGAGKFFIIYKEILPNIFGSLLTQAMVEIPSAIFMETFLSFVGLGLPVGSCSLGSLISAGFNNCLLHPYKLIPPVIILIMLMMACNLISDGLKEALDPARNR